jgi:hypothetical protein
VTFYYNDAGARWYAVQSPVAPPPVHTGDVTNAAGSLALTIANGAVSLSKMANLAANSMIGNNTGAAAPPIAMTAAQTTGLLNAFTSTLKGLTPSSGGGTVNFLRADGTWASPPGPTLGRTLAITTALHLI